MTKVTVKFARGPQELYNLFSSEQKQSIVYFSEDTNEIYVRDIAYGINLRSEDLDIISKVEATGIGTLKFTFTNGKTISVSIPEASNMAAGLMSAADKAILDDIPNVYATKEELNASISKVYRFRGVKQFYTDLPTENLTIGDVYNILNGFDLDGEHYNGGTNVAWDGEHWDPLGGNSDSYTKEEADEKFVPWTVEDNVASIVLPKGSKIISTKVNDQKVDLLGLVNHDTYETVELGNLTNKTVIKSSDRPAVELPNGEELVAYLKDIGYIDMEKYGSTYSIVYIPELTQSYIDELPTIGDNLDNNPITSTNTPKVGKDYVVVFYTDDLAQTHIDWFTPSNMLPNATYAALQGLREEYLDMFSWMDLSDGSQIPPTPEQQSNSQMIQDTLADGTTSSVEALDGTTKNIIIPDTAKTGATVTVNLDENSTLKTSKRVTLVNNSDTPANLTIDAPSGTSITLKGKYDVIVTPTSVTINNGSVNQIIIPESATQAITINTQIAESLTVSSSSNQNITISGNTNADADLIIVAPQASVTLNGTYDKVTSTTADNTLVIGPNAYMDKLVVKQGNVVVKDINVENRIGKIINNTEYTVECAQTEASAWDSFKAAATTQGITNLGADVEATNKNISFGIFASGNYRWNLNGHNVACGLNSSSSILVRGSAHIEVNGPGAIVNNSDSYGLWVSGGTVDIYGGDWSAYTHTLYCEKGAINVYGGTFTCLSEDKKYTLNCLDANYSNGTAKITVYGGIFYGFNPEASMSEPGSPVSFLAEGKRAIEIDTNVYQVIDA